MLVDLLPHPPVLCLGSWGFVVRDYSEPQRELLKQTITAASCSSWEERPIVVVPDMSFCPKTGTEIQAQNRMAVMGQVVLVLSILENEWGCLFMWGVKMPSLINTHFNSLHNFILEVLVFFCLLSQNKIHSSTLRVLPVDRMHAFNVKFTFSFYINIFKLFRYVFTTRGHTDRGKPLTISKGIWENSQDKQKKNK